MDIAIDFDGTIVEHLYPDIGKDIGAFPWIKKFKELGAKIILYTMRDSVELNEAVEHCKNNGVEFDYVNDNNQTWTTSRKVYANLYIDDMAFGCPLHQNPRMGGRPYVDWDIVGPAVVELLSNKSEQ